MLYVVMPGKYLHLPDHLAAESSLWLSPGGVLDMSDPYVARVAFGQEYKLEPAPAGAVASPFPCKRFENERNLFMGSISSALSSADSARAEGQRRGAIEKIENNIQHPDLVAVNAAESSPKPFKGGR